MSPARTIGAMIFATALGASASAGDETTAALGGSGSPLPQQQAQLDPASTALPPKPQQPMPQAKPDNESILMMLLLSHTQFGPFGRMGQ
jgi:hypothetical protein